MHVGQSEIAPLESVGQLLVVDAEQMQDGRVQVVNVHAVLDDGVADVVRLTIRHACLDAATSQPHRERFDMVVAADRDADFAHRRAPELAAPDHEGVHQAIVAAITPIVQPMPSGRALDNATISRLRETYIVFQLDAIAYPGNSGSPLYDPETGEVYGIVNSVFVKTTKERILDEPSGIAYAIPIRYAKALLEAADVSAR